MMKEIELPKVYRNPQFPPGEMVITAKVHKAWFPDPGGVGMIYREMEIDVTQFKEIGAAALGYHREMIEEMWAQMKSKGAGPVDDYVVMVASNMEIEDVATV